MRGIIKSCFTVFVVFVCCYSMSSQELPSLNLKANTSEAFDFPVELNKNDIGVILHLSGGWSAYDNKSYYIYKENGDIIAYSRKFPKTYLRKRKELKETLTKIEVTLEKKQKLLNQLNASTTLDFLQYDQENFRKKTNGPPGCPISDNNSYKIAFVQNGKVNSYKYYAPDHQFKNCNNENINKLVLGKYIELIDLWWVRK